MTKRTHDRTFPEHKGTRHLEAITIESPQPVARHNSGKKTTPPDARAEQLPSPAAMQIESAINLSVWIANAMGVTRIPLCRRAPV